MSSVPSHFLLLIYLCAQSEHRISSGRGKGTDCFIWKQTNKKKPHCVCRPLENSSHLLTAGSKYRLWWDGVIMFTRGRKTKLWEEKNNEDIEKLRRETNSHRIQCVQMNHLLFLVCLSIKNQSHVCPSFCMSNVQEMVREEKRRGWNIQPGSVPSLSKTSKYH